MSRINLGPTVCSAPLTVSEDAVIEFEAKALADLLGIEDLSTVTTILVRIENPNGGSVHQYTGGNRVNAAGTFNITLGGSDHTTVGVGRGRILFDAVTVPKSRFQVEWEDAF